MTKMAGLFKSSANEDIFRGKQLDILSKEQIEGTRSFFYWK